MGEYRYTFRLMPGRDDDLIEWLESLGKGEISFYIRQVLRRGLAGPVTPTIVPQVRLTAPEEPPRPVAQEAMETVPDNDIEAKLDRLADIF